MHDYKIQAIQGLFNCGVAVEDAIYYIIDIAGEKVALTPQQDLEIDAEVTRLQAAYDALEYSRLRKAKYDLLNQDEMRYDDLVNNTTTWRDGIAAIKAAHPKP